MPDKKKRGYQSANRLLGTRRLYFDRLIATRLLDGLTWEEVPKRIATTLHVTKSQGRHIRKLLTQDWHWLTVSPSVCHITNLPFEEFKEEHEKEEA